MQATLGASPRVQLRQLQVLAGEARLQLTGLTLTDADHWQWRPEGKFVLHPTTVDALRSLIGNDIPLQAGVEGVVDFSEDAAHPHGTLLLRHPLAALGDHTLEFDRALIYFTLNDDMVVITKETTVRFHGASISLAGTVPFDQRTLAAAGNQIAADRGRRSESG